MKLSALPATLPEISWPSQVAMLLRLVATCPIERFVELDRIALHIREWPGSGRPVILVHHLTGSSETWSRIAPELAADAHVFALDLRGHGRSSKPRAGYSWSEGYARDVEQFLQVHVAEPACLVGLSLGAMVCVPVAVRSRELVSALVLEDPPAFRSSNDSDEIRAFFGQKLALRRLPFADRVQRMARAGGDPEQVESSARAMETWCEEVLVEFLAGGTTYDAEQWFPRVECPVLIVVGDPQRGSVLSLEERRRLKDLLTGSRLVVCDAAGHAPHEVMPEHFVASLRTFLREVEARRPQDRSR